MSVEGKKTRKKTKLCFVGCAEKLGFFWVDLGLFLSCLFVACSLLVCCLFVACLLLVGLCVIPLSSCRWRWPPPRRWKREDEEWVLDLPEKILEEWDTHHDGFKAVLELAVQQELKTCTTEDAFRQALKKKVEKLRLTAKERDGKVPTVSFFPIKVG